MLKFKRIRFYNGQWFEKYVVGEGNVIMIEMEGSLAMVTIQDGISNRQIMVRADFIEGELL